jgi:DNA primase
VATPLSWPEVDDAGLDPGQFTMATIGARLGGTQDPWSGFTSTRHGLGEAGKRLARLER